MIDSARKRAAALLEETASLSPGLMADSFNRQALLGAYGLGGVPPGVVPGGDELLRVFPGTDWLEVRVV